MAEPRIRLRNPFRFDGILDVDQGTPDRILDEQGAFGDVGWPTALHVSKSSINTDFDATPCACV